MQSPAADVPLWAFITKGVCMYLEYLGGERLDSWVTLPNGRSHYGKEHDTYEDGLFFRMTRYKE